jgi:hypothetical protein
VEVRWNITGRDALERQRRHLLDMIVCELLRLRRVEDGAVPDLVERIEGGFENNLGGFDGGYGICGHGEGGDDVECFRRLPGD